MANVTRWDPFSDMLSLRQAMDRLFEDAWVRPGNGSAPGIRESAGTQSLAVDLYESQDELVLSAAVPGFKPDDLEITIQGDVLTIKGEMKTDDSTTEGAWHRRERRYGNVFRQVSLPVSVKSDSASAEFENGVLKLHLPKAEGAKERRIPISSGSTPQITEHAA